MTWARLGDTSATNPIVLTVLEHEECDERLVNEVHGFALRCATESGSHKTDYVVSRGTAVLMAGPTRVNILLAVAIFAGYMTEIEVDGRPAYKLVDDNHDFLHLRLKEEIEFEQQRRKDNSRPSLVVPVRLRDGDACRWCGRVVDWGSRKAARSGTYDHLIAGEAATIETYVVSCTSCNSSRKDGTRPKGIDKLLDAPEKPYYSVKTIEWLAGNTWRQDNDLPVPTKPRKKLNPGDLAPGITPDATTSLSPAPAASTAPAGDRPDTQPGNDAPTTLDTATAARPVTPAPRTDKPSADAPSMQRPDTPSANAQHHQQPAETPDPQIVRRSSADSADLEDTEPALTGRDGSGRDGSGRVSSPTPREQTSKSDPPRNSARGRRRRKRRPAPHTQKSQSSGDTRG